MTYEYTDKPIVGQDYTDDTTTRFNGLPGEPEVWYEEGTGKVYMVYVVPGSNPPIFTAYHVPNEDVLQTYFGEGKEMGYDKRFTPGQMQKMGVVVFGTTAAIADTTGDPWAGFLERIERAKSVMPWLDDPEVLQIIGAAYLEDRAVGDWEFTGTDWWMNHTEGERRWLELIVTDPLTAEQELSDAQSKVMALFRNYGVFNPDQAVLDYVRNGLATGKFTEIQAGEQVKLVLGLDSAMGMDAGLQKVMSSIGSTMQATNNMSTIRELYDTWLGPMYAPDDKTVQRWVNQFALDPEAANQALIEQLRQQRLTLFPGYDNPNSTYQDIAGPWKSYVSSIWGLLPDDTDTEFQNMIRANDASEVAKMARRVGLERDYDRVKQKALFDLDSQMNMNVRGTT